MANNPLPEDPIKKRVFERIAGEHPRPRWEFVFRNYFFWGLGALAIVLGALAIGAMIFEAKNVEWNLALVTHRDLLSFLLDVAPFLWLGALVFFILIGYMNVRRTNHGYRYPLSLIALGAVLISSALGAAVYATGFGSAIEDFSGNLPFHQSIFTAEKSWWLSPEKGLISGVVVSVMPDMTSFVLKDFSGTSWQVDGTDLRTPDTVTVARGGMVRVIGLPLQEDDMPTVATSSLFHACFVLPWQPHNGRKQVPPPFPIASSSERSPASARSDSCKGIRPYEQLRSIDDAGF